jgi:endonuclease YncB( thermonuclease family)
MGTFAPNRRLPSRIPGKPSTPAFVRARPARISWLNRYFGFLALAVMMGTAAILLGPWQEAGVLHSLHGPPEEVGVPLPLHGARVTVIDGDSLRANGRNIRLTGIDAPELFQTCRDEQGREWSCGRAAKARLEALVSRGKVACRARGRDRYERTLAVCAAGDVADVGEALVREGYAVDYGGFTSGYPAAEREARAARRGVWRGNFERPQEWRRRHPRAG